MNDSLITFTGWVGSKVEVAQVLDGVPVASFRVGSTPRRFRDGKWDDGETLWYSVKAWRRLATNLGDSLRVGDPVVVCGRMEAESWTAQDGTTVTRYVVVASSVGHDLSRGTASFVKPPAQRQDSSAWDVPRQPEAGQTPEAAEVSEAIVEHREPGVQVTTDAPVEAVA